MTLTGGILHRAKAAIAALSNADTFPNSAARRDRRIVNLRPFGMFSNVCEVVQHLHNAERDNYTFDVNWQASPYLEPTRGPNAWDYYFDQPFPARQSPRGDLPELPGGGQVVCRTDNIITPCRVDREPNTMYLPANVQVPHDLIARYIKLNAATQRIVDDAAALLLQGPCIGVHIRGPAGIEGGNGDARIALGQTLRGVPVGVFQRHIHRALKSSPDARILVCSDDADVIDRMRGLYPDRIVTYDAFRLPQGEMHMRLIRGEAIEASPYRLGLDVLVEAYLLGRTDILIHDYSNVSRFARCLRMDQPKVCIYD